MAKTPGAIAVLHTRSRLLDDHSHVYELMPAAAIDRDKGLWRTKTTTGTKPYPFSHKALAKIIRAKLLDALSTAGLTVPARHPVTWVFDCKAIRTDTRAMLCLGRHLYRGVIREMVNLDDAVTQIVHRDGLRSCFHDA